MLESELFWFVVMIVALIFCGEINKKRGKSKKEFIAMSATVIILGIAGMVHFGGPVFN